MTPILKQLSQRYMNIALAAKKVKQAALVTLLGCGSLFVGAQGAIAADAVVFALSSGELTISIEELKTFAETGELSAETQEFFDTNRQDAPLLQEIMSEEIVLGSLQGDIESFLGSSTGEFVLIQLDKFISRSPDEGTLEAIRVSLRSALENGRFSIVEIAENYPEDTIYLDLRNLETAYRDVELFVERIRPALETAREYLQDLICDCETVTAEEVVDEVEMEDMDDMEMDDGEMEMDEETSSLLPMSNRTAKQPSELCNTSSATTDSATPELETSALPTQSL